MVGFILELGLPTSTLVSFGAKEAFVVGPSYAACPAIPLASPYYMPIAPHPEWSQPQMSPDIPRCPLGDIHPIENHCLRQMFLTLLVASHRQMAVTLFL